MRRSIEERMWDHVRTEKGGCWLWEGYVDKDGYGRMVSREHSVVVSGYVHRMAWEQYRGAIPKGMQIDHLCKIKNCVNPEHLEVTSPQVNNLRSNSMAAKYARRDACKHGHPLTGANVRKVGNTRVCQTCNRQRVAEHRARHRHG